MCEEWNILFNELKGYIHDDSPTSMTETYVQYFSSEGREKRVQELVERIRNNESTVERRKSQPRYLTLEYEIACNESNLLKIELFV